MDNNIIFILPADSPTGAEQVIKQLAQQHHLQRDNVFVLISSPKTYNFWSDMEGMVAIHYAINNLSLIRLLRIIAKGKPIDRVYTTHTKVTSKIEIFRCLKVIKINQFVARESTTALKRFRGCKLWMYKFIYKYIYRSIDLLICQTALMREDLMLVLGSAYVKERCFVIPNPLATNFLTSQKDATSPFEFPYIIAAGRFIREKGFDILLKSFALLAPTLPRDWKLVIAGDGELKGELKNLASDLSIDKRVVFPGMVTCTARYFAKAELCVCSSRIEGFPNILLQMMSQNNKVVSTLCAGGIDEIRGIFTTPPNDEYQLTAAIAHCLGADTGSSRAEFAAFLEDKTAYNFLSTINFHLKT